MELAKRDTPRTYQWFDWQAEADVGGEAANAQLRSYHVRFLGLASRRFSFALHVARLYRRQDDGGEEHRAKASSLLGEAFWSPLVG